MTPAEPWIVIADGQRARIVRLIRGARPAIEDVLPFDWVNADLLAQHLDSGALGSGQASAGSSIRHGVEPRNDPRRQSKQAFATRLADYLSARVADHAAAPMVLIAAPATLGDIRAALSDTARAQVVREIDKDLTKEPEEQLAAHLIDLLD
ncbi:host attachment protein [Parapedomonas caeni]